MASADLPTDLVPLPTSPWDERPTELPLVIEEVRTAIWLERGNITRAAERLKVTSLRLRKFVANSPYLSAELEEANHQLVDIAVDVAYDALTDDSDKGRKDAMARFVLNSPAGRARGFGSAGGKSGTNVQINSPKGTLVIAWEDGTQVAGPEEKVIEGVANDA